MRTYNFLLALLWFSLSLNVSMAFSPTLAIRNSVSIDPTTPRRTQTVSLQDNVLDRFANPKIDDPWLPLTEAGLAQIVAPTLQLFWLVSAGSPYPSWAKPLYDPTFAPRGAFLAPTLVHGAGLACCWILGCLAAKAFERDAFEGNLGSVVVSTVKAGAFATGVLILATQVDFYQTMGGYVQFGDSPETDLQIIQGLVEVINDIVFEAVTLLTWRVFRSKVAA